MSRKKPSTQSFSWKTFKEWVARVRAIQTLITIIFSVTATMGTLYFIYLEFGNALNKYMRTTDRLVEQIAGLSKEPDKLRTESKILLDQIVADVDQLFERLASERNRVTPRPVEAPILANIATGETKGLCQPGEYVVGLQVTGVGTGGLFSSGRITFMCAAIPRLKLPKR